MSLKGHPADEQPQRPEPQPAGGRAYGADADRRGREGRSGQERQHGESEPVVAQHHRDAQTATSPAAFHHQQVPAELLHTQTWFWFCSETDPVCVCVSMSGFGVNRNPGFMNNSLSNNIFNGTGNHRAAAATSAPFHTNGSVSVQTAVRMLPAWTCQTSLRWQTGVGGTEAPTPRRCSTRWPVGLLMVNRKFTSSSKRGGFQTDRVRLTGSEGPTHQALLSLASFSCSLVV